MRLALKSDLKIGNTVYINIGGKTLTHILRKRIDKSELNRNKIYRYPKEETESEYKAYKKIIEYYLANEYIYVQD